MYNFSSNNLNIWTNFVCNNWVYTLTLYFINKKLSRSFLLKNVFSVSMSSNAGILRDKTMDDKFLHDLNYWRTSLDTASFNQ